MITQEQATRAVELLKDVENSFGNAIISVKAKEYLKISEWKNKKNTLLAEIKLNTPTNGDKWRSMTDEQIAEIIQRDGCCVCPVDEKTCEAGTQVKVIINEDEFNNLCKAAIVKWLKQEASND